MLLHVERLPDIQEALKGANKNMKHRKIYTFLIRNTPFIF